PRAVVETNRAVPTPARGQQPGASSDGRAASERRRRWWRRAVAVEPARRGERIGRGGKTTAPQSGAGGARGVGHVAERVPHFARRAQDVVVVAVREHGALPAPEAVELPRASHRETLHAAR